MNVAFGDIFNQGRLSVYVTNISEEGVLIQGNNLWVPKEGASGDALQYENLASSLGVELGGWSFGAQFGDLNNDGTQDLFLTNGYVSAAKGRATGTSSRWWPAATARSSPTPRTGRRWRARASRATSRRRSGSTTAPGHFNEVAQAVGYTDTHDGRGVALVDLWNRGVLDVLVANQRGPLLVYKNTVPPENAWVDFELHGTPVQPQRHRCPGSALLERPGAASRGQRRLRLRGPEPAPASFRPGQGPANREGRHPLALRARFKPSRPRPRGRSTRSRSPDDHDDLEPGPRSCAVIARPAPLAS